MVSTVAASGPINWSKVILPPGRTQQACYFIYYRALQDAKKNGWWNYGKEGGDAGNKKGGSKEKGTAKGMKRERPKKGEQLEDEDDEKSDCDERVIKKEKLENSEDDSEDAKEYEQPREGAVEEI